MLDENLRGTNWVLVDTFDSNSHIFSLVEKDGSLYLQLENDNRYIKKLVIKPDLWAFFEDGSYEYGITLLKPCHENIPKVLAMDYNIDPSIFNCLVKNSLISYSKGMADLYQLPPAYSSDIKYHHRDYKKSKNKKLVLDKLRRGEFN